MTDKAISPLRRRMIEDMKIRRFSTATQRAYLNAVKSFDRFLGDVPLRKATADDVRQYQLYLVKRGMAVATSNQAMAALRFLYRVTLPNEDAAAAAVFARKPEQLPVVLSPEEVG